MGLNSSIIVFIAFILGLSSFCCFTFVTVTPCWYVSYAEASISPYENCYGLWMYCSSTGLCGKWLSGSLLGPHGVQRISCRALMITACTLSVPGLLLNCFGMKCVLLLQISNERKMDLLKKASLCYGFAGLSCLCAATWYAIDVAQLVWGDGMPAEFSDGIFVGWVASATALGAAGCLCIGRVAMKRESEECYSIGFSTNILNSNNVTKSNEISGHNNTQQYSGAQNFFGSDIKNSEQGRQAKYETRSPIYCTYDSEKLTYM